MLFMKKFDRISPSITLYFKGDNMHSSTFSGLLTIVAYTIIFIYGINYILEFFNKSNPTAFFYNRFIEDAGFFPLNASSMFHYIQLKKTLGEEITPINFDMVRIIGIQDITIDNYPYTNLESIPHWLYSFCNNNSDTINIGYLITSEAFNQCACIRKYYDNVTKQYYDANSNNFKWPSIEHGMSNVNHTYYGIIVEKCKNDNLRFKSGKDSCENIEKIDNYIFSHVITLYLIDHYSDVVNYNKPFTKYLYSISNMLFPKYFTVNNINFNPSIIKTHKGIILDNTVDELSYFFTQNEKVTMDEIIEIKEEQEKELYEENIQKKYSTGIVSSYYFWMQNRLQYYERNYKKLQDILSNIGGLSRVVLLLAIGINKLIYHYIILLDTENLALSLDNKEKKSNPMNISPTIYRKINILVSPPKKQNLKFNYNNNSHQLLNINKIVKEDFAHLKCEKIKYTKRNNINKYFNKEKNENKNINEIIKKENTNNIYKKKYNIRGKNNKLTESNDSNILNQLSIGQKEKEEIFDIPSKRQNFSWFTYIKYKLQCLESNTNITFYEEFRDKILSEESIIQNHLKLYKLYKLHEQKINS